MSRGHGGPLNSMRITKDKVKLEANRRKSWRVDDDYDTHKTAVSKQLEKVQKGFMVVFDVENAKGMKSKYVMMLYIFQATIYCEL